MNTLFVMSLVDALMSLLAVFGVSAMTVVPRSGAESTRVQMMLAAGIFGVAWVCLAFWARVRRRAASQSLPPQWLRRLLVSVSVVYLLGVLFLAIA
jgi:hypothetical protein